MADKNNGIHVCEFLDCNKTFKKKSRLLTHVLSHTGERPHVCSYPECGKSYPRVDHLRRHIQSVHESETSKESVWKCEESDCEASFSSNYALKKHVARHHDQDSYKCHIPKCEAVFKKHHQLKSHMIDIHSQGKSYICEECKKSFPLPAKLKRHMRIHEGYVCTAEGCNKKFDKWTMLVKHRRMDHTPVHECSKCNKKFSQKQWLKQHMLTHADERQVYVCTYENCGREYLEKRNLNSHVRSYHDGKRFSCDHAGCGQTFSTKQKLMHHQKLHDPNRPLPKIKKKKKSLTEKLTGVPMVTESRGLHEMSFKSPTREDCIDLPELPNLHTGSDVTETSDCESTNGNNGIPTLKGRFNEKTTWA
ncbi:Transcription factor IIIA [Mactra antiquata]